MKKRIHLELDKRQFDLECEDWYVKDQFICFLDHEQLSYYNIRNVIAFHITETRLSNR